MQKKKVIIGLIIAVIILAIVAGILAWKKSEVKKSGTIEMQESQIKTSQKEVENQINEIDTSGWKTYENEEYGFEIKYPEGWFVRVNEKNSSAEKGIKFLTLSNYQNDFTKDDRPADLMVVSIVIYDNNNSDGKAEYDWGKKYVTDLYPRVETINLQNNTGNIDVFGVYENNEEMDDTWSMTKPSVEGFLNGARYSFDFHHATEIGESAQKKSANFLRNIMQTFSLSTNQSESENQTTEIDTSDWKTYKNDKFGYEVKYPSNWKVDEYDGTCFFMNGLDGVTRIGNSSENIRNLIKNITGDYLICVNFDGDKKEDYDSVSDWRKHDISNAIDSGRRYSLEKFSFSDNVLVLPGHKLNVPNDDIYTSAYYFFNGNDGCGITSYYSSSSDGMANEIISSLRFDK